LFREIFSYPWEPWIVFPVSSFFFFFFFLLTVKYFQWHSFFEVNLTGEYLCKHILHETIIALFVSFMLMLLIPLRTVSSLHTTVRLCFIVPLICGWKMRMEYPFFSIFKKSFQVYLFFVVLPCKISLNSLSVLRNF